MQEAGGLIQSMTQGQSLMQTLTEALETVIPTTTPEDGAYLLQLQAVHGEAADLLLDRDGDVVAVECSFGSVLGPAIGTISKVFGSGLDPACVDGFFPLTLEPALGDVPRLMSSLAESFGGAKVFPESKTDRQFGQLVKALGVENGAKGFGLLQSLVDTVPLPPAQDGIVSVTPPKQTGKELGGLMQEAGGLIQSMTQGQSLMQTLTEALETVIPRAP
jgi:hypothetical protein